MTEAGSIRRREAVSICVFRDDAVLLVRRARAPSRGLWAPVGGGIEPGETAAQAALRETMEETGLAVRLLGETSRRRLLHRGSDGGLVEVHLRVHAALWIAGAPVAASDAADARFVALADLERRDPPLDLVAGVMPHIRAAARAAARAASTGDRSAETGE